MILSDLYLWLSYTHLTTRKINGLLDKIDLPRLWESFDDDADVKYKLDEKTFNALKRTRSLDYIEQAKQYLEINHIKYVTRADPIYPIALDQREVDPPPVIYYKGDISVLRKPCFAIVGTRNASQYGRYAVERIAGGIAGAFTVVSGMATGIDGYAHAAALKAGGTTAAVLGSGLFNPSPVSNLRLYDEICEKGVVLSEYTPDTHATKYTFPERNRIISGLCRGVLVAEAAERSGSLITARCALEQGRDVFAVPGDIDKPRSTGTNKLIKSGAIAVTCAEDILDEYSLSGKTQKTQSQYFALDFSQQQVLDILEMGEKSFDMLVESCGMTVPELNAALSALMIYGLVHEKAKNLYCISK